MHFSSSPLFLRFLLPHLFLFFSLRKRVKFPSSLLIPLPDTNFLKNSEEDNFCLNFLSFCNCAEPCQWYDNEIFPGGKKICKNSAPVGLAALQEGLLQRLQRGLTSICSKHRVLPSVLPCCNHYLFRSTKSILEERGKMWEFLFPRRKQLQGCSSCCMGNI